MSKQIVSQKIEEYFMGVLDQALESLPEDADEKDITWYLSFSLFEQEGTEDVIAIREEFKKRSRKLSEDFEKEYRDVKK